MYVVCSVFSASASSIDTPVAVGTKYEIGEIKMLIRKLTSSLLN
jgi:hypothetical protein